jgi:hypothetical protein
MPAHRPHSPAPAPDIEDEEICAKCGGRLVLRRRKPKLLSYLLFLVSFVTFFIYSSVYPLSAVIKIVWFSIQVALFVWAYVDRRNNAKRLFYCRSCDTRLPF